ncbi:MAG: DUF1330 domain-containing protein [Bacillota bacterium]
MSYYFVANIKINDPDEYQKYLNDCNEVFVKFKGKYLAVDNNPEVLEGEWKHERAVIIRFESEKDFRDWYQSSEYQNILKYRLKAAKCDTILIKGLSEAE